MCSASSWFTRSRIATATSTINRSAPRPERRTASACAMSAAWVTVAPFSIAIFVAVVSCPLSVPTIRSRMMKFLCWGRSRLASRSLRLDDFRHRYAELFLDQNDLATRDQPVIDINVDRFSDLAVELQYGTGTKLEQVSDVHPRAPEHGRNLNRYVEYRFKIGGASRCRSFRLRWHRHVGLVCAV